MIPIVIAVLFAFGGTASAAPDPAPSATAAPPAQSPANSLPTTPLRECIFKVSALLRIDAISESYGGGANATVPGSSGGSEDDGIVTVDVMGKYQDGSLAINVLEKWRADPATLHFEGAVAPDGTVDFPPTTINAVTRELLPYFATAFASSGPLAAGSHWTVKQSDGQLVTTTDYTVKVANGDTVTIAKKQSINAVEGVSVNGNVVYNSALLVPISGQLQKRTTDMEADGQDTEMLDLRFDLVSDTFQKPAAP